MKTEVYSWRVSADLKTGLEREARRRRISVSVALDLAARDWLRKNEPDSSEADEQERLRTAAMQCIGVIEGSDPHRAERAGELVRERLRRRNGR
jgi:hypothetical protein